jgi:hypothetical protein
LTASSVSLLSAHYTDVMNRPSSGNGPPRIFI